MSAIAENQPYQQKASLWLIVCAVIVMIMSIILRLCYCREIPAEVSCEIDAALRMVAGGKPYLDFYSDQLPLVLLWRLPTLALGSLCGAFFLAPSGAVNAIHNWHWLGFASVTITALLSLFSFAQLYILLSRYAATMISCEQKWLLLLAFALGNLAMGFEYGQQQHIFVLLAMPFLLLRFLTWQGLPLPAAWQIATAGQAAFGGALSLFYIIAILVFELVEMLARRLYRPLLSMALLAFLLFSVLFWSQLFLLSKAESANFLGWILALKFSALTHDNYSFYGSYVTPERKELLYTGVIALIVGFGLQLRLPVLRPLAALSVYGLIVFMTCVLGLSCDALILTFFICLLLTVEFYYLALYAVRTYPRFFTPSWPIWNVGRPSSPAASSWLRRKQTVLGVLCSTAVLLCVGSLLAIENGQRKLAKTAATRLAGQPGDAADLQAVIEQFSNQNDRLLILNGNLRPTYPLLTLLGRRNCGYLLDSTPLGTLANIKGRHYWDAEKGTSQAECKKVESDLYSRLGEDIVRLRPTLICVQSGVIDTAMHLYKIDDLIAARYKRICEAQYHCDRVGSREISEPNYNYWVYRIK